MKESILEFNVKYPEVYLQILSGTHEELYYELRNGKIDIVINDLRRKPSTRYVNYFLTKSYFYAELAINNPLSQLETITMDELKNTPLIIIAPEGQRQNEELFCREYLGVKGDFIFAENLEDAHLLVIANKGYFSIDFYKLPESSKIVKFVPIMHNDKQIERKYYAFWRADTTKKYIEEFAEILKSNFPKEK